MARKGFAAVGEAAGSPFTYEQMKANQQRIGPSGPSGPIVAETEPVPSNEVPTAEVLNQPALEPEVVAERHPIYDSQDGEDGDSGHAHLMHDLGLAIQEIMAKDPETNKSMTDLMEEYMGKGVDYDSEAKRLRKLIEGRKTPKQPNWIAAGVGSWAGGPEVRSKFEGLREAATGAEKQKQADLEDTEASLLKAHVDDLRTRGKTKEALLMGLMQGAFAQKRVEAQQAGQTQRAREQANLRRELQDRSLGAAEERVRIQVGGRADVADKDRTQQQVMHLYETLLRQTEKDITGAVTPLYSAEQAMDIALTSILPKVKAGVQIAKEGPPPVAEGAAPTPAPATKQSKFAQWKAQQATRK